MTKRTSYTTVIGADVQVAQNKFTASTSLTVTPEAGGLEILGVQLKQAYAGGATGAALSAPGTLYFFDSDPAIAAGTANNGLTEAQINAIIGQLVIQDTDWTHLANNISMFANFGGLWVGQDSNSIRTFPIYTVYVAFLYTGATQWNSAAGDEEVLSLRLIYK